MNNKKIANNSSSWMKQFEIITQHPKEIRALFGCCCWFFFFFFFFLIYLFLSPITHHFLFNFCHSSLKILKFPSIHPFGNCFHFTSLNYFYCFAGPTHGPKEYFFFFFFPLSFFASPELFSAFLLDCFWQNSPKISTSVSPK